MQDNSAQAIATKIFQFVDIDGLNVLEIGCGDGRVTALLAETHAYLTAIDPDRERIAAARKSVDGVNFRVARGERLDFPNEWFDLVVFTLSFHHHEDCRAALKEAARVTTDSGTILVIEPRPEGEIERVCTVLHDENKDKEEAQRVIRNSELVLQRTELFSASWIFDDADEMVRVIFDYYSHQYDAGLAAEMREVLGNRLEERPLDLSDTMIIQMLGKAR